MSNDEIYMLKALKLAQKAKDIGEVPVGAVIVDGSGKVIGQGYNQKETQKDPTLHAEIIAIKEAVVHVNSWRLSKCSMYVTLEPCPMCAGALVHSRIQRLIFGTADPKGGGISSKFNIGMNNQLNHQLELTTGILEAFCSEILKKFFQELRSKKD